MTARLELISHQLLQKEISLCSVEELQQLSQQYPFFAPIQFVLLEKLREENDQLYLQQLQKASLYHHNPAALDLLINAQKYQTVLPAHLADENTAAETFIPDEHSQPNESEEIIAEKPEETVADAEVHLHEPSEPQTEVVPAIETSSIEIMEGVEEEVAIGLPEDQEEEAKPSPEKNDIFKEGIIGKTLEPTAGLNSGLSFEPYHTVDYFASQGIKLSQEEVAKDNFGRQLKSFTEWLKTMKRLPAAQQLNKLDPHAEERVENIAAHSLDNSEILTEAMAEVWIKQGKLEKAIEVYNKLSLLNPSKRTYFADKLENLKKAI